jgi:ferritin-like metal-binding protein YciE
MSRPSNILLPAINYDHTLVLSIELSNKSWVLAAQVPGLSRTKAQRTIEPNKNALLAAIDGYRARAAAVGYTVDRVITTYEAGWSGFWLARWLVAQGVEVHVVQPSSVPVDRRLRRAKSDGIDAELRLEQVLIGKRPQTKPCEAINGIVAEGEETIEDFGESTAIDTGLVAAGQAVEHYEMARYGALIAWAGQLDLPKAVALLNENLQEEMKAERLLTQIGASKADKTAATKTAA